MASDKQKRHNWLKASLSLLYLKEGLVEELDDQAVQFHDHIKKLVASRCATAVTAPRCTTCTSKLIKRSKTLTNAGTFWYINCKTNVCNQWLNTFIQFHEDMPGPNVEWANCDPTLWASQPWEVAKVFQPFGCKNHKTAEESDVAGLLTLVLNCQFFHKLVSNTQMLRDIKECRNKTMHSATLEVEDAEIKDWLDLMIGLLEDKTHLGQLDTCKTAADKIRELRDKSIEISFDKDDANEALGLQIATLTAEVAIKQRESDDIRSCLGDLTSEQSEDCKHIHEELSATAATILKLNEQIEILQKTLRDSDIPHVKDKLFDLQQRLQSISEQNKEDIRHVVDKIGGIESQVDKMTSEMGEVKLDMGEVKTEIGEVKSEMVEVKSDMGEVKTEIGEVKSDMGEVERLIGEVKSEIGEVKSELSGFQHRLQSHQEQINSLHNDKKTEIGEVKSDMGEVKREIGEVKSAIGEVKSELSCFKHQLQSHEETINSLHNDKDSDKDVVGGQDPREQSKVNVQVPLGRPQIAEEVTPCATSTLECENRDKLESSTFDGRLIQIDSVVVKRWVTKAKFLSEGAFGVTYKCQGKVNKETLDIVIKKISCKGKEDNRRSAIKEMLASRLKHHHIVPLLAFSEHTENEIYYFIMPYMEKGDLLNAIFKDTAEISNNRKPILDRQIRLKILNQLASVLKFLHEPVENVRECYVHGDISSRNIVLDGEFNIRLLDFGLSKERKGEKRSTTSKSSNMSGTKGYVPDNLPVVPERDCYSWAAVALELLTGLPACGRYNNKLMEDENVLPINKKRIESVWGAGSVTRKGSDVKTIMGIVQICKSLSITAKDIVENLKDLVRREEIKLYTKQQGNTKCMICMVNKKVTGDILGHKCGVDVCVACLRNSYLNPIQCPNCLKDLSSPIGNKWGAVLIAGNAVGLEKEALAFKNDVDKIYRMITSTRQLAMGIRENRVKRVYLEEPGQIGTLKRTLENKFTELIHEDIDTLFIYFTGHTNGKKNFILGSQDETISEVELNAMLQELLIRIKQNKYSPKLIIVLDYCYPSQSMDYDILDGILKSKLKILKLTSSDAHQPSNVNEEKGSLFTNLLIQCLSGRAGEMQCLSITADQPVCFHCIDKHLSNKCGDGFVSAEYIIEYTSKHMREKMSTDQMPNLCAKNANWMDSKIGYYLFKIDAFQFLFDCATFQCHNLPEKFNELMEQLHTFFIKEKWGKPLIRCKHFMDVYAVVVKTGAVYNPHKELKTLEKIEAAWNGLSPVHVVPRNIENIDNGKVGFFVSEEGIKPEFILAMVSKKGSQKGSSVSIPLGELKDLKEIFCMDSQAADLPDCQQYLKSQILDFMVNGYITKRQKKAQLRVSEEQCRASQKCADHQNRSVGYFCETDNTWICVDCFRNRKGKHHGHETIDLEEKIDADQQLSKEQTGKLVFTFPLDENGEYEKFFSVHIEDDNLAENGNNELAGQSGQQSG